MAQLAILPGGAFGAGGAHAEIRGTDGASPYWILAGYSYEAGAARPHLKVDVRAEAGAVLAERAPVVGGGARWHFWLAGPLAVSLDGGAHFWIDGTDTALSLSGALTLGVAI